MTSCKTGPGLLTRAVACFLTRAVACFLAETKSQTPWERVAVLPYYMLRRHVQVHMPLPHKQTQQHWKATNTAGVDMKPFFIQETPTPTG